MATFQVGDRVRCVDPAWGLVKNDEYVIIGVRNNGMVDVQNPAGDWQNTGLNSTRFELITSEENKKMATVNDVMNLELDADTALLRTEGIEDNTGALTSNGQAILLRTLYLDNRAAVITKVKAAVAARKADATDEE